jgi:hypothetical protein
MKVTMKIFRLVVLVTVLLSSLPHDVKASEVRPPETIRDFPLDKLDKVALLKEREAIDKDSQNIEAARYWLTEIHDKNFRETLTKLEIPKLPLQLPSNYPNPLIPPESVPTTPFVGVEVVTNTLVITTSPVLTGSLPVTKGIKTGLPRNGSPLKRPIAQWGGGTPPRTIKVKVILYSNPNQQVGIAGFPSLLNQLVTDLNNGSRYHGGSYQSLVYSITAQITVQGIAPLVPAGQPSAGTMNMAAIYNQYGFCQQFEDGTLDQVWTFSDGSSSPWFEYSVKGRLFSTTGSDNNQPVCGEAGAAFGFVYSNRDSNGVWFPAVRSQALHSYSHYLETGILTYRWQYDQTRCDYLDGSGRAPSSNPSNTGWNQGCLNLGKPPSWQYGFMSHANSANSGGPLCSDSKKRKLKGTKQ